MLTLLQALLLLAPLQALDSVPPSAQTRVEQGLERKLAQEERDDWQTEALDARVAARLTELVALFERGDRPRPSDLEYLVTRDFHTTDLRPVQLDETLHGGLRVLRPAGALSAETRTGAGALSAALGALFEAFPEAGRHAHLKRLSLDPVPDGRVVSTARVELSAHDGDERVQAIARWSLVWRPDPSGNLALSDLTLEAYEELRAPAAARFVDATRRAFAGDPAFAAQVVPGLDAWRSSLDAGLGVGRLGHHGLALGDVDGDGLEDLFVAQPGGLPNRLYLRGADGGVREVAAAAGVDHLDTTRGVLLVDLDGDADLDLALGLGDSLLLLENRPTPEGQPRFGARAELAAASPTSLSAADYDGDGDLDLYVTCYDSPYEGASRPRPYHDARNGAPNVLFANGLVEGQPWRFADVTVRSGIDDGNDRFSFAAAWEDYDDDGDPDLYVANDFGRNNLYRNDAGRFSDVAAEAGVEDVAAGMGVSWGDVDGDGDMDLAVANMFSSAGQRIAFQERFQADAPESERALFQRHSRGNSLFLNRGDGSFEDASLAAGISMGRWAWGQLLVDLDGDGALDLFVPNGFVSGSRADDL